MYQIFVNAHIIFILSKMLYDFHVNQTDLISVDVWDASKHLDLKFVIVYNLFILLDALRK